MVLVQCEYTCQRVSVKALLIILPKQSLIESRQFQEEAAHNGKNHENESNEAP